MLVNRSTALNGKYKPRSPDTGVSNPDGYVTENIISPSDVCMSMLQPIGRRTHYKGENPLNLNLLLQGKCKTYDFELLIYYSEV